MALHTRLSHPPHGRKHDQEEHGAKERADVGRRRRELEEQRADDEADDRGLETSCHTSLGKR